MTIEWIDGEVTEETAAEGIKEFTTRQLVEIFDYLRTANPRRTDAGRIGDEYSAEFAEVQNEIERRYFEAHGLPEEVVTEIQSAGIDWTDEGYSRMAELIGKEALVR